MNIKHGVRDLILSIIALVIISSMFYHYAEHWKWIDSAYMTIMTITTVGHSDLIPTTDVSKIFTATIAFVGIAMVLTLFGIVSSHYVRIVYDEK